MSAASRLKFCYLAYASKPKAERFLYRAVRRARVARIVEFGLTSLTRSRRLIEVAERYAPGGNVCYTAFDPFESAAEPAQSPADGRSLKGVFRALKPTGASVRLLPGLPGVVLADAANTLTGTDFLLIGHTIADDDLAAAWFYLPRMLHPGSLVVRERIGGAGTDATFERIGLTQIQSLAVRPRVAA